MRSWIGLCVAAICTGAIPSMAMDIDQSVTVIGSTSQFKLKENEGDSDSDTLSTLGIGYQVQWDRVNKISMEWRPVDMSIGAAPNHLSADVKGNQIALYWSRRARLMREFKPWLSVGFRTTKIEVSNKKLIDGDGYVVPMEKPIGDRSGTDLAAMIAASLEWEFNHDWSTEFQVSYDHPIDGGFEGFGAAAMLRYQF